MERRSSGRSHSHAHAQLHALTHAGVVAGAVITTYLLEKSRVVFQGPNERNYHALYMLQQGAEPAERAALSLEAGCADYTFLRSSGCFGNPEWGDDAAEYCTMRGAMRAIGLAEATQAEAAAVLAAVLHMGNVSFTSDAADEYAAVADEAVMATVSRLMGCDDVRGLVLQRTMKVPGAVYNIQLTPLQARAARNAFGKAVYCLLFDWVVAKVRRPHAPRPRPRAPRLRPRAPRLRPRAARLRPRAHRLRPQLPRPQPRVSRSTTRSVAARPMR